MPKYVTVSDEREGADLRQFVGILLQDEDPPVGEQANVAAFVTDNDNGFGWPVGFQVATLKLLGDGNYGS